MPTRPNTSIDPTTGQEADHLGEVLSPPQAHEHEDTYTRDIGDAMVTQPINLDGTIPIRVDCQCNAYNRETVNVPFVVIYDQLLEDEPTLAKARGDDRITSTFAGGVTGAPTKDFRPVHVAQAAATMRNMGLIPFSPFGKADTIPELKSREAYGQWSGEYLNAQRRALIAGGADPNDLEIVGGPSISVPDAAPGAGDGPPDLHPNPVETALELAATFPGVESSVDDIQAWINDSDNPGFRAEYALLVERNRRKGPRPTLLDWILAEHGVE